MAYYSKKELEIAEDLQMSSYTSIKHMSELSMHLYYKTYTDYYEIKVYKDYNFKKSYKIYKCIFGKKDKGVIVNGFQNAINYIFDNKLIEEIIKTDNIVLIANIIKHVEVPTKIFNEYEYLLDADELGLI